MRFLAIAALILSGGLMFGAPSADAAGFGALKHEQTKNLSNEFLTPVYYGRGQILDALLHRGYEKIRLIKTYRYDYDRRIYKFKACRDGLIYYIRVNDYGEIVRRTSRGLCAFRIY